MEEHVSIISMPKDFQTLYEGEIWFLCTVTFVQKSSKLNNRRVYCLQLYSNPNEQFWKNKVLPPYLFMRFWTRNSVIKLNLLTPQDLYW